MAETTRKIEVDSLVVGMYVAGLDRPWLETPFLFQGFVIKTKSDIEELQRYCSYVVIDLEQSPATIAELKSLPKNTVRQHRQPGQRRNAGRPFWHLLRTLFSVKTGNTIVTPQPGDFYKDSANIKEELVSARGIHESSVGKMTDILIGIRQGGAIELPALEAVAGSMVDSVLRNSTALALLVRMRNKGDYIYSHSISSSIWALVFGRHLGLDRESLKVIGLGALLLDVGKTKLPKELLTKIGELSSEEDSYVRNHVELSVELVKGMQGIDRRILDMVATHHERHDGSGYPQGLKGNQIPVFGRVGGIVDSYSAMTSDRPYASSVSSYDAMREFKTLSDKSFQSEMVEQFIQAVGIFPAGTLVELNTGEVGIVIKEHNFHRLRPKIAVILDAEKQANTDFRIVDLNAGVDDANVAPDIWIERGIEPGTYDIDPTEYFL